MENDKYSPEHHDHLALASTIKLAEKHTLPAAKQKLSIMKRNRYGWSSEAGLDVRVGIFFAVVKPHPVLRYQRAQRVKHVARHVRIGVFVDCQPCGGVLDVKDDDTFLNARFPQLLFDEVGDLD